MICTVLVISSGCAFLSPLSKPLTASRTVSFWMPGAVTVQIIGDWNEWGGLTGAGGILDPSIGRMDSENGSIWTGVLDPELPVGKYRYAFLVNGLHWVDDPSNPESSIFQDHEVSVLSVSD